MEIFKKIKAEEFVRIFIYAYLEINMIFYSEKIEVLNGFMFIFSSLCYPFNNTPYNKNIVSYSVNEINNLDQRNYSSMIGINHSFIQDIRMYGYNKTHLAINLDKGKVFLKIGQSEGSNDLKEDDAELLEDFLKNSFKNEYKPNCYLEKVIFQFTEKIRTFRSNYCSLPEGKGDKINFFSNKVNSMEKEFQNECYSFMHYASQIGKIKIVKLLVALGSEINTES